MTNKDEDDPAMAAFLRAGDEIGIAIKDLSGWDACLALIIALARCIVVGNSMDDEPDAGLRLAQSMQALGDVVGDMMIGDWPGGRDEDPRPSPPSPDLLRKLLEQRRAAKSGHEP